MIKAFSLVVLALLMSVVLIMSNPAEASRAVGIMKIDNDPMVDDSCNRPGGPHPGCPQARGGRGYSQPPANPYNRGCLKINRCRTPNPPPN